MVLRWLVLMSCGMKIHRENLFTFLMTMENGNKSIRLVTFILLTTSAMEHQGHLRWCNVKPKKSDLVGALVGFGVMLPIEIMDGFSASYGASPGDLIANAAGSAFFLGQALLWKEQRILPKFSFHQTEYAAMRPSVLGDGALSEMFKDYNGQTYWLSVDMDKFIRFPKWLNLAVGYGAEGMVYARDEQNIEAGYPPAYRQYYLSIDFDLRAIKSRSKAVNTLIFFASMIKIPAPTIEFSSKGTKVHAFYF